MDTNLFKKAWFGSCIKGARELEEENTYDKFSYEELPPIRKDLTIDFSWLPPFISGHELIYPGMQSMEDSRIKDSNRGVDFGEKLNRLEKELNDYSISLPNEIKIFFTTKTINSRIRSTTDNYFELSDYVEVIKDVETFYLIHFMSDSQYCLLWYICFDQKGNHFIGASTNLYGHEKNNNLYDDEGEEESCDFKPKIGYYCAENFLEFIYRYNIEQRIWFKTRWFRAELNRAEKDYIQHYLELNK